MNKFASKYIASGHFLGIIMVLIAYFLFSFVDTSAKWLGLLGMSALQIAFMRYFSHFVISLGLFGNDGFNWNVIKCEQQFLVILRGACLMLATVANFFAVRYLSLSLTSTILFSTPIIVCALSWPLLKERVGMFRWMAIGLGFIGILIAIRPFDESFHWAVFLSLAGALLFAFYSILTSKLSGIVPANTMQFWSGLVGTVSLLPFALLEWQTPSSSFQWIVLLSLGVFAWAGHQLLTNAMSYAPANLIMPFGYSFILYLMIWSFFVFDELPDHWTILGALVIVLAGLLIWFREKKLSTLPTQKL